MDLIASLKASISDLHREIESTPYARAILDGSIGPRNYASSLEQFLPIHQAMEQRLAGLPETPCYDPLTMARTESLKRDLAWWGGSIDAAILPQTEALTTALSQGTPLELLGALYVFEGSRMGSMYLARSLSQALQVPPQPGKGLDYHVDGIAERPKAWRAFLESLAAVPLTNAESQTVIDSAAATMSLLLDLYAELPATESRSEIEVFA